MNFIKHAQYMKSLITTFIDLMGYFRFPVTMLAFVYYA